MRRGRRAASVSSRFRGAAVERASAMRFPSASGLAPTSTAYPMTKVGVPGTPIAPAS